MKRAAFRGVVLVAGLVLSGMSGLARADRPIVSLAPFVWGPSLKGQLNEGPITIPLDAGIGDLAGGIRGGGMLHAEVTSRRIHASVQVIYVDFHDSSFAPILGADVRSTLFTVEALAGPVIAAGPITLSPMVGIRHTRIKGAFEAPGLGKLKAGNDWREGLVGIEAKAPLTVNLTLRTRMTVAVAGPDGQSSSDIIVAGCYRLSRTISLTGGYRWAREKVQPATVGGFGLDLDGRGPLLGLVIDL